jgi:hypothetical protein
MADQAPLELDLGKQIQDELQRASEKKQRIANKLILIFDGPENESKQLIKSKYRIFPGQDSTIPFEVEPNTRIDKEKFPIAPGIELSDFDPKNLTRIADALNQLSLGYPDLLPKSDNDTVFITVERNGPKGNCEWELGVEVTGSYMHPEPEEGWKKRIYPLVSGIIINSPTGDFEVSHSSVNQKLNPQS